MANSNNRVKDYNTVHHLVSRIAHRVYFLKNDERMDFLQEILRLGYSDYTLEQAGVTVTCRTETEGFETVDGTLQPMEGAAAYSASFAFTMELNH